MATTGNDPLLWSVITSHISNITIGAETTLHICTKNIQTTANTLMLQQALMNCHLCFHFIIINCWNMRDVGSNSSGLDANMCPKYLSICKAGEPTQALHISDSFLWCLPPIYCYISYLEYFSFSQTALCINSWIWEATGAAIKQQPHE